MKYKISIIIPIYNIEEYLPECIESVLKQSYSLLQIILVDDGSTDGSSRICDEYAKLDSRIEVIHKKNGGLVSARKEGLKYASGEYIGFVDGDDYIDETFYEVLLQDIMISDADFVHTGYIRDKGEVSIKKYDFNDMVYKLNNDVRLEVIKESVFEEKQGNVITSSIWSKLFKGDFIKKCYEKVPDKQCYGEDFLCLCIALLEAKCVYLHKTALYHYRIRSESMTNLLGVDSLVEAGNMYNCTKDILIEYGVYALLCRSLERFYFRTLLLRLKRTNSGIPNIPLYYLEDISKLSGKRIVLYGAGNVGKDLYFQLRTNGVNRIVGWVDKDYKHCKVSYAEVIGVPKLKELQFDVILIAMDSKEAAEQIKTELSAEGFGKDKILWICPKLYV